jgi:hypothetical protein
MPRGGARQGAGRKKGGMNWSTRLKKAAAEGAASEKRLIEPTGSIEKPKRSGPFQPGESGNPAGRPLGSRNRLGEAFLSDLLVAWRKHGADALETVATEKQADFVRVTAQTIPKQLNVDAPGGGLTIIFGGRDDASD